MEGDLLLMRVLIGRTLALIAWQLCIHVCLRYFCCILAATRRRESLWKCCRNIIVDELNACTHASGSRRIQAFTYRYLVTQHSINQHGKEGSKEGRS